MASITTFACPLAPMRTTAGRLAIAWFAAIAGEARHGRVPRSVHSVRAQDSEGGEAENSQVEPERSVVHVPHVQTQALFPGLRIAAVDLRPPRDSGTHFVPAGLLGRIERQIF